MDMAPCSLFHHLHFHNDLCRHNKDTYKYNVRCCTCIDFPEIKKRETGYDVMQDLVEKLFQHAYRLTN